MSTQRLYEIIHEEGELLQQLQLLSQQDAFPPLLLQHLACDCALRALELCPFPLAQIAPECFVALELRQVWLVQQSDASSRGDASLSLDEAMIQQAVDAARGAAYRLSTTQQGVEAAQAAADASDHQAYALRALAWAQAAAAARTPSTEPKQARQEEAAWQRQHLIALLASPKFSRDAVA